MKLANILLLEMSLEDARKLLAFDSKTTLDKAYRNAAKKHHPDKGGTDEMMKKVNQAYELLKASGGGKSYSSMSDDERKAAWQARKEEDKIQKEKNKKKMEAMLKEFSARFEKSINAYNEHFKEFFTLEKPTTKEEVFSYLGSMRFWGKIKVEWPTKEGETEIRLNLEIKPEQGKGLADSSAEPVYNVDIETFLYHNRKNHKMGRRSWVANKSSNDALDPNKVFPKAKLKKIVAKVGVDKMTRKDFEQAIRAELKKYKPDFRFRDSIVFDFSRPDNYVVDMHRGVFNRTPYWTLSVKKINDKKNQLTYAKEARDVFGAISWISPESSKGLDGIKDFLNKFIKGTKIDKGHFNHSKYGDTK